MLYKYPRTYHLPWSKGITKDDRVMRNIKSFEDKDIVGSLKMDGENSTLYSDYLHARSLDYADHPSRHWLKGFHASVKRYIPKGWRVCGENVFAVHSITYTELSSYFLAFSVWTDENICLSWEDTVDFCDGIFELVPVFYKGKADWPKVEYAYHEYEKSHEGYVIRLSSDFKHDSFGSSVAKYVRGNHVQTDEHWMNSKVVPNKLKK